MQKTIFVAGVHGVGKTYLCESVAHLGLNFSSASEIIKNELSDTNWTKDKVVSDVDENQLALVSGVKNIKNADASKSLLLDGHFVLRSKNGFISLDHSIFSALDLDAVLLIEDDADKVAIRLEKRDAAAAPKDLEDFLKLERAQAEKFITDRGIPFFIIKSGDTDAFLKAVKKIIDVEAV